MKTPRIVASAGPPMVSVLMPVYNTAAYVGEAIESILEQTWRDFELLLLDDGSTDGGSEMMQRWAREDDRVVLHQLPHLGLVATLNRGLELARGRYLVRADADDVSLPDRISRQVELMERRPEVGLSGSGGDSFPEGTRWSFPSDSDTIRCELLFSLCVAHPTWIIRRSWLDATAARYDSSYQHAEDYELLERVSRQTCLANLPNALVRYRQHPGQISRVEHAAQRRAASMVRRRQIAALGVAATSVELDLHDALSEAVVPGSPELIRAAQIWFERLSAANAEAGEYPEPVFTRVLSDALYRVYVRCPSLRPTDFLAFRRAALDPTVCRSPTLSAALFLRGALPAWARRGVHRVRLRLDSKRKSSGE